MTPAGQRWTRNKPTEPGWYWNRISDAVGVALIIRRDCQLYAWLWFKDAWLSREGWLDYIHGEWQGPLTPKEATVSETFTTYGIGPDKQFDELQALRDERDRLRKALRPFAEVGEVLDTREFINLYERRGTSGKRHIISMQHLKHAAAVYGATK